MFAFGPFRLDTLGHTLQKDGKTIPLPPKAFELLLLLVKRNGELLSKGELLNTLWPNTFVEENNLTQYVSMLRKLLGEGANEDQKYIETVPRLGYRFVGNVQVIPTNGENQLWATQKKTKVVIREEEEEEFDDVGEEAGELTIAARDLPRAKQAILELPPVASNKTRARWQVILVSILALAGVAGVFLAVRSRYPQNAPAAASSVTAIKPRHSVAV